MRNRKPQPVIPWIPWPSDSTTGFEPTRAGLGRGEERLSRDIPQFMGLVQGVHSHFDILSVDGVSTFEVKELVGTARMIRATPNQESWFFTSDVCHCLKELMVFIKIPGFDQSFKDSSKKIIMDFIREFSKGSFSRGRMDAFIKFVEEVIEGGHGFKLHYGRMMHPFLLSKGKLKDKWETYVRPSSAFPVTGLILTHRLHGYYYIPKNNLDVELAFDRISKFVPYFKVVCPGPSSTATRRESAVSSSGTGPTSPSTTAPGPA
jgi:hypothetical protein